MSGGGEVDEAAREASALRDEAQQVLTFPQLAALDQFVEHDVDRGRTRVADPHEVREPAFGGNRQSRSGEALDDRRAEILGGHVREKPIHVPRGERASLDDTLERFDQRVFHNLVVEEPHVLLQGEQRLRFALVRRVAQPAPQSAVRLLFGAVVHARRQLVRVGENVYPLDAQIESRARRGLQKQRAGTVGQHPAQKILFEYELGVRLQNLRSVQRFGVVVLREQAQRCHFRAGNDGVARAARSDRHPAVLQSRGARKAHARGRHRFADRRAEFPVDHDGVVGHELIRVGSPAYEARQIIELESVRDQSPDRGCGKARVRVVRLSSGRIDHVIATPDAVVALYHAACARRALADLSQDRLHLIVLDGRVRQAHRAARDVGGVGHDGSCRGLGHRPEGSSKYVLCDSSPREKSGIIRRCTSKLSGTRVSITPMRYAQNNASISLRPAEPGAPPRQISRDHRENTRCPARSLKIHLGSTRAAPRPVSMGEPSRSRSARSAFSKARPKRPAFAISSSATPAPGRPQKGSRRPVSSQRGVVMKLASVPPRSTNATLSRNRPPASWIKRLTASCAASHMLRHAITVTTGRPRMSLLPVSLFRKAVMGPEGARYQTWYASTTRSNRSSARTATGSSGGGSSSTVSGITSRKLQNDQGNGYGRIGRRTSSTISTSPASASGDTRPRATRASWPDCEKYTTRTRFMPPQSARVECGASASSLPRKNNPRGAGCHRVFRDAALRPFQACAGPGGGNALLRRRRRRRRRSPGCGAMNIAWRSTSPAC